MENLKLSTDERKRMLEFTSKITGEFSKDWTDRELLVKYNEALAQVVLWVGKKAKG